MKISPQRLHFILIDTKEILEKVYSGGGLEDVKVEKNTETFKSIVRSAFATWLDNDTAIPAEIGNMKSSDFLEGSLLFLPDCDDHYSLSYFICFVLKKRPKNPEALKAVFQACLNGFVEQGVEKDSPHIYEHISILLCQMIINNVITVEEAKGVHQLINGSPEWDPINDLKYYILDYHDFSESPDLPKDYPNKEIWEALHMPSTINSPKINSMTLRMSRLLAISVVRSVFAQANLNGELTQTSQLDKWKNPLKTAMNKQGKAFEESAKEELRNNESPITYEQLVEYLKK